MRGGRIVLIRGGQIVLMRLATDAIDRGAKALGRSWLISRFVLDHLDRMANRRVQAPLVPWPACASGTCLGQARSDDDPEPRSLPRPSSHDPWQCVGRVSG